MSEERTFHKYGEKKAGTNNKFYEVEVKELEDGQAKVYFTYGRIGTEGKRLDKGTFHSYGYAVSVAREQFQKKEKKGYREVTAMEAIASACEDVTERKVNGFESVELTIPKFHAGSSEKRCQQLCKKYMEKLNVIRASRWDLTFKTYRQQIEAMLKQYCAEWARIIRTKAHGALADNSHAHTAFRIFFAALRDDTKCNIYGHYQGIGTAY